MRVFQFVSYSADSDYFSNLGKGLDQRGIEIAFGTLFQTGREFPGWIKPIDDARYYCLGARSRYDFPMAVLRLASILRTVKPDILQTHLYEASLVGLLAAKLARVPIRILTRHHTDQAHLIGKKLPIAVDRWEATEADVVVVLSNAVRNFMISVDGIDPAKIRVVYQGFDFEKFSANEGDRKKVRSECDFADDDFVIGTFGNFFPTKGHRFLLAAAERLVGEIPNLKLLFVGDGGDKESLKEQISKAGLSERIVFAGFRKDVSACMKACDVVVHPSLSEAFCQVLIESMSTGVPLISTDVGGAGEVIEDGKTGLLIASENVDEIVEAVRKLYLDRGFGKQIAMAGQQAVREKFTIEKMLDQQIECYETLISTRNNAN